ncbi:SapC family protein [Stakelama marina]|uniref:SapC family protein n=1 Tax=Stakelama marina TaxID=2826939 RepID=A0A8T4IEW8_9SPHN|nr:SapC family protein [Stakelama marina]MBR0552394.1 SapC family protein [Stakelama marina]
MASAPQTQSLPLFYKELIPLSRQDHAKYKMRPPETAPFLANVHAVPVTVEEFPMVQRRMPIVFSVGDDAVPLALMGLNEGVNLFVDDEGKLTDNTVYLPAYIRRYPFLLARLQPESEELSLCFDPSVDWIGEFDDGEALFTDGEPSEFTKQIMQFNEQFEQAGQRTAQFVKDLREMDLLMDGEVSIQPEGAPQPFIYRGFQMINEDKLREMRGDQLRKIVQNGMLPLIYAHLMSLSLMRDLFGEQMRSGKMPQPDAGV